MQTVFRAVVRSLVSWKKQRQGFAPYRVSPSYNVTANHTIYAVFAWGGGEITIQYVIDASAGEGGTITPHGKVYVVSGGSRTFTIAAADGYQLTDVLVDGISVGAMDTYTFANVRKNHTIQAVFAPIDQKPGPDDTGVSQWLNTKDHMAYLHGYDDGTFGPDSRMTRAEAAQLKLSTSTTMLS